MRSSTSKIILLFMAVFAFVNAGAQSVVCNGSLGDPVLKYTFGAGSNTYGPALGTAFTDFGYVQDCPEDGQYTILNHTNVRNGSNNCHPEGWQEVDHDHTGDPNGYMMLVNASDLPSKFFTYNIPDGVLCPDTKYEFSAYILNLIFQAHAGPGISRPDIVFSITQADGTTFTYDTGDIPESVNADDWRRYSMPFRTPSGNTAITLVMTNKSPGGIGNDLLLDDIEFRACGPLILSGFSNINSNAPQSACAGTLNSYNLIAQVGPDYINPKYQWQKSTDNGVSWVDIAGETQLTYNLVLPANAPAGNYQYRIAAAAGNNISSANCRTYSSPLTVVVNDNPVNPVIQPVSACEGEPFTINASGGATYEWTGPGVTGDNKNQQNLTIQHASAQDAGAYQVKITSVAGCSSLSNTVNISVNQKPVFSITGTRAICAGSSTVLSVAGPPNLKTYSWVPADGLSDAAVANPTVSPAQTTTYKVTVTDDHGCSSFNEVTVTVKATPMVTVTPVKKIFEGKSTVLDATATDADTYLWTPADGLDDPTRLNPVASPTNDITYTLHASSALGCGTAMADVFVKVFKKIIIPTVFTPNGDGTNDTWNIEALETYPQCVVKVFNRNGQEVFSSIGYSKAWNGGYHGYVLPSGTYYYTIDLKDGNPIRSGWVFIAR
ncbi:gliding motility-associated-like protein [Mucilaginibacter oryzae]|uniref:Gliding motility-associated-like protein n=2 Tax=Mucilaginibacter oryzae TaxID=468058 RepID=A0A316HIH2_9SPHI|nr:gliding motility-associated-like protein [Mucilaginibacter oryzae]